MRLFLSAGEASGDAYAARLAQAIRARQPDLDVQGVGGRRLASSGAELIADSSHWGALGILEAVRVAPRVIGGYRRAVRGLKSGRPGVFIPIDFGYMNIKLARAAKALGWRVLYFIPPGSWRRNKQGADLPSITDEIVTPFPWSAELLNQAGARAHWFGHPLKQMIAESTSEATRDPRRIAILPGSRAHEIQHNLPVIAEVVRGMADRFEFAVASSVDPDELQKMWAACGTPGEAIWTQGDTYGVLKRSQAALVCSGTATLEAALCGCPCVVLYRGSKWMELEYRIRKPKFDYIALPNILMDAPIVPERIQADATVERLRDDLGPLLVAGSEQRVAQETAFRSLADSLGPSMAIDQTADLAVQMLAQTGS